jgi:type I restriction enzyme, S subunit
MAESSAGSAKPALTLAEREAGSALRQRLVTKGWWFALPQSELDSEEIGAGAARLDAEFYTADTMAARTLLDSPKLKAEPLTALADIWVLGRFKRVYTSDPSKGAPYLSASEAFSFRPEKTRFLATEYFPNGGARHFAKRGWILLSTSGSVGRPLLVTSRLEPFILTHDLARIIVHPGSGFLTGYVYAVLASPLGSAILRQNKYGSSVRHLEPSHIQTLPIPKISVREQQAVDRLVVKAYELRDEANLLLDEADAELHKGLGLPKFDPSKARYLSLPPSRQFGEWEYPDPAAFEVKSSALEAGFVADAYNPVLRAVLSGLEKATYGTVPLGPGVDRCTVAPRFARVYVRPEMGVPFLQGSDIPTLRPFLLKHLSRKTPHLDLWKVQRGWVLVTCSGTIGEVAMVPKAEEGWAASQHILRIVPKRKDGLRGGYVAGFLLTPYGRAQLVSYGAVVKELTSDTMEGVRIPDAPPSLQDGVGAKVERAFELKSEAIRIEEQAIQMAETAIRNLA